MNEGKFRPGDLVRVAQPGNIYEENIKKHSLIGRVYSIYSGALASSSNPLYTIEFDFREIVAIDPKAIINANSMFGVWPCGVFDNNRGRRIRESVLELAYDLPEIEANVNFISELLGK